MALSGRTLLFSAGALWLASIVLFGLSAWSGAMTLLFTTLHIGSVVALFFAFKRLQQPGTRLWNGKAALLALCLPLFGLPVYWMVARRPGRIGANALRDYEDHVKYRMPVDATASDPAAHARLVSDKANLQPFLDVIYSKGNGAEKVRTLQAMAAFPGRDTVEGIRCALNDAAPEVRFAAVSALKKIEAPILRDIQQWSDQLRKSAGDPDAFVNLGNLYYNYCYMGLLDRVNAAHYAGLALASYEKAALLAPERTDLWISAGKTRILLGDFEGAEGALRRYVAANPADSNGYIWMAECLYEKQDYRALSAFLRTVPRDRAKGWERFESVEKMWI